MADWTAITGIVVSGVVGPGVAGGIAWRLAVETREHDRVVGDRAEARVVLDDAAVHLREAIGLAGSLRSSYLTHGRFIGERDGERVRAAFDAFKLVEMDRQRIVVRFGVDSPVTREFAATADALIATSDVVGDTITLGDHTDLRESWGKLGAAIEIANEKGPLFLRAAYNVVGVHLDAETAKGDRSLLRSGRSG